MSKSTVLHGSAIGLAQLLATLVVFALGMHQTLEKFKSAQMTESVIGFVLLMIIVSFAHRAFRKESTAKDLPTTLLPSVKFAVLLGSVAGLITGIAQYAYFALVNPTVRKLLHDDTLARIKPDLDKLGADGAADMLRQVDYFTSAGFRGLVYGMNTLLFTTLLTIAFALIFKASVKRDQALQKTAVQ
ncbi:MAG: hypothetical protein RIQ79_1823 [Verrucomicrobiota bacterium]|jgi:hypothetical protein